MEVFVHSSRSTVIPPKGQSSRHNSVQGSQLFHTELDPLCFCEHRFMY